MGDFESGIQEDLTGMSEQLRIGQSDAEQHCRK